MRKHKKGFTLVEILVAVAILAVLAAIFIPSLFRLAENAKVKRDSSLVSSIVTGIKNATDAPDSKKEIEKFPEPEFKIIFTTTIDGKVDYHDGELKSGDSSIHLEDTAIFLNLKSHIGDSAQFYGTKYKAAQLVFTVVPASDTAPTSCILTIEGAAS